MSSKFSSQILLATTGEILKEFIPNLFYNDVLYIFNCIGAFYNDVLHIFNCIGVLLIQSVYQSKMSKQLNNRKKVLEIFLQNPTYSHLKIAKLSKVAKSSVVDILRRQKETQIIERKRGSGRKKVFVDKNKLNSIIRSITTNPYQSQRYLAKTFECSCFLVRKALKSNGLKAYTKTKIPIRSINGELKAIHRARKLVKLFNRESLCIIEDN